MNPLTNMKNVKKLSEQELKMGIPKTSWHDQYKSSAWIFIGGLPYDLTEGDIICVFSQYGEIVNINYVRDKVSGKPKGFCFICYENQKSTILAVDNFNGIKILGRIIRVDHVQDYKPPKDSDKLDPETRQIISEGCAPKPQIPEKDIKAEKTSPSCKKLKKVKKEKKTKSKKSKKSKHRKRSSSSSDDSENDKELSKKSKPKKSKRKDSSSETVSDGEMEILAIKEKRKQLEERLKSLEEALKRKNKPKSGNEGER